MIRKTPRKRTLSQKQVEQRTNRSLMLSAGLKIDPPWTTLERAVDRDGSHTFHDGTNEFRVFINSRYTVMKREFMITYDGEPNDSGIVMVHLSIRRNDRKPVVNWRDMQQIKNELVGRECEGVQIFPAESRLVDNANQYHIYVCADPESRLPFGYNERLVSEGAIAGAVQEPFEPHVKPDDLIPQDELNKAAAAFAARCRPFDSMTEPQP